MLRSALAEAAPSSPLERHLAEVIVNQHWVTALVPMTKALFRDQLLIFDGCARPYSPLAREAASARAEFSISI